MDTGKDRQLGDEWADWDGSFETSATGRPASSALFMFLSVICFIAATGIILIFFYLVSPRLVMLGSAFVLAGTAAMFLSLFLLFFFYILILFKIIHRLRIPGINRFADFFIGFFSHYSLKLGLMFGLPRDAVLHSFILFNNSLIETMDRGHVKKVMVLLPRCLTRETIDTIKSLTAPYSFPIHVVPGGDLARAKVREYHPQAIIAVACERDLYSGLRDTPSFIPVYAIPNQRPDGPCKNTCVDIDLFKKSLALFSPATPTLSEKPSPAPAPGNPVTETH